MPCSLLLFCCVFLIHGMLHFLLPVLQKTAQKACGVGGCRKAELPRCLPGLRCAEGAVPAGFCPALPVLPHVHLGSSLHCTGLTGSSEIPPFLYPCPVLLDLMAVPVSHFSASCRSVRVLTVFLSWQYWCECSECLSC